MTMSPEYARFLSRLFEHLPASPELQLTGPLLREHQDVMKLANCGRSNSQLPPLITDLPRGMFIDRTNTSSPSRRSPISPNTSLSSLRLRMRKDSNPSSRRQKVDASSKEQPVTPESPFWPITFPESDGSWMRHFKPQPEPEESVTHTPIKESHCQDKTEDRMTNPEPSAFDNERLDNMVSRLESLFSTKESYSLFRKYQRSDIQTQALLNLFQGLLDNPVLEATFRHRLLDATQRLAKATDLYPDYFKLQRTKLTEYYPYASGGFADVYKGIYEGLAVCLKVVRISRPSKVKYLRKRLYPEAILLGQLKHQNILPFYGVCELGPQLSLVSPWAENGDVNSYLKNNPCADRTLLSRDVAYGVEYLHDNNIIHGDLKGANILVDSSGRALVADFGLSGVMDPQIIKWTSQSSSTKGGSTRWQAPELFGRGTDEAVNNSKASDIYALGCVLYEIFSGEIPFFEDRRNITVMCRVSIEGKRPSRPPPSSPPWSIWGLTELIWELMGSCWAEDPTARPAIVQYINQLNQEVIGTDNRPVNRKTTPQSRQSVRQHTNYPTADELENLLWGETIQPHISG